MFQTTADRILDTLRTAERPLRQNEVAARINAPQASVRRVMQKLEDRGLVRHAGFYPEASSFPTFAVNETTGA